MDPFIHNIFEKLLLSFLVALEKLLLAGKALKLYSALLILLSFLCWARLFEFFHSSS